MRASRRPEPSVETVHVDPAEWSEIYLVGDVHGCAGALSTLLDEELAVDDDDLVVFVGDLVRKGPDSAAVVDRVRGADNLRTVRGNNEQKLLDGDDSLPALSESDLAWMADLPLAITLPGTLVVHGGVDADVPLADHTPRELMTMRATPHGSGDRPYWFETRTTRPTVVFGHTVLAEPHHTDAAVGLDTGCVHGRALSYYDWRADEVGRLPVETVHEERPPSKVLEPETPTAAHADD